MADKSMARALLHLLVPLSLLAAGCGGGSSTTSPTTPPTSARATPATAAAPHANGVVISERDFAIDAPIATAPAGALTFAVNNQGPSAHELLVFRTDLPPDKLPLKNGRVDEDNASIKKVFDSENNIDPNSSKAFSVNLPAGHYVLVCNLEPNHYLAGMHAEFTVTS